MIDNVMERENLKDLVRNIDNRMCQLRRILESILKDDPRAKYPFTKNYIAHVETIDKIYQALGCCDMISDSYMDLLIP